MAEFVTLNWRPRATMLPDPRGFRTVKFPLFLRSDLLDPAKGASGVERRDFRRFMTICLEGRRCY